MDKLSAGQERRTIMAQGMQAVPVKIGQIVQEALDDALDIIVSNGDARSVAEALRDDPRLVVRRLFRMNQANMRP
jgi:hypothetical protein